jgi:hypothetical protein
VAAVAGREVVSDPHDRMARSNRTWLITSVCQPGNALSKSVRFPAARYRRHTAERMHELIPQEYLRRGYLVSVPPQGMHQLTLHALPRRLSGGLRWQSLQGVGQCQIAVGD